MAVEDTPSAGTTSQSFLETFAGMFGARSPGSEGDGLMLQGASALATRLPELSRKLQLLRTQPLLPPLLSLAAIFYGKGTWNCLVTYLPQGRLSL